MDKMQTKLKGDLDNAEEQCRQPLTDAIRTALQLYFDDLDGHNPASIYKMVIMEVERPMFEAVMEHVKGNQSHAARMLGISRSTLRKKLRIYELE